MRCCETEGKSCGESYRFHGKTSSRRHIERNDRKKEIDMEMETKNGDRKYSDVCYQ
jgi:hypothetical protein